MRFLLNISLNFFFFSTAYCVVSDSTAVNSTAAVNPKFTVGGFLDTYYGYNFNQPAGGDIPYFVSMSRHNEVNINLAYLDLQYSTERARARLIPGFGTYINANYAAEPGTLKNIVEGYGGVRLSKKGNVWLDAGVFGSPYTNESACSKDHLMYTRSYAPEYVPYYLSGAKLSIAVSKKLDVYFYFLNGWQQIKDANDRKSLGTQLQFRPSEKHLFNWNTYIGDERSVAAPFNRMRYFTDIYYLLNPTGGKFCISTCAYAGLQETTDSSVSSTTFHPWWQANLIGRIHFNDKISLSGRVEYFSDKYNVQITPVTGIRPFDAFSSGLCLNIQPVENMLFRLDLRNFYSSGTVFYGENNLPVNYMNWAVANITVWF